MARKLRGNSRKAASKCFTRRKPSHSQRRNPDKCLDDKFTIEHISKHGNTTIEIRPGALHHDVACYDENTLREGRASSTLHQLSCERLTTVDEDFPMGCGLRVGQRKAPKKCFTRCKKRNSCPPGGKSAEVPIFNEEQSAVEDTAFILKPVDCAVASPNPSSCKGNLCQARTSTPSNQLPSDRLPTVRPCSPIDFVSLPADHDLDHSYSNEACSKGANNIPVVPFEVAEVQILYSSEEDSLDASNNLEKSSDIEILESSQENSFDALGESGLEAKTIRSQATVSPAETLKLKELQTHIQRSLPPDWLWIGSVFPGDEGITLFKVPSTGISLLPQRQITILRDGTVHLLVHGNVLSPDHEIWAQLPPKLSFESQSVDNLSGYVLAVVKLVHGYDICPGCPLPQHQNEARKMGAIFCPNLFRERKYSTTHRSVDCGILIVAKTKSTACPTCKTMERNIRKRLARRSSTGSPEATVNNKFLDGPQVKQKLRAEKMLKRNALAREKYYRKKLAVLLGAKGTDVEGGFSEELPEILEHHRNEVLGPEDNSDFS